MRVVSQTALKLSAQPKHVRLSLLVVIGLLAATLLMAGTPLVGAQDDPEADELGDVTPDSSENETTPDKPPIKDRHFLNIGLPSLNEEGKTGEPVKGPREPAFEPTMSNEEIKEAMRRLQQDYKVLKAEIAELRSELRSILPEKTETTGTTAKQKILPFWITDEQLKEKRPG